MTKKTGQAMAIVDVEHLDGTYFFRHEEFGAEAYAQTHSHSWGHLNYASHGTLNMHCGDDDVVAPPQYGIWVPPHMPHSCRLRHAVVYRAFYVAPPLCARLPHSLAVLRIGPIIKTLLADFAARGVQQPRTPEDERMARVMLDQLIASPCRPHYLPAAQHPALVQLLEGLQERPDDHRSAAELAAGIHMTERTLARHCQRELGMSLGEWRLRLRYLQAVDRLEAGRSVQDIAFDLGYSTASAFIAMFQRVAGMPPDQFRREFCQIAA
ncbi:AraC family transcriptional regulator [Comamonas serinivorans]|nr:helix-turn-helix transcriptional regulator [Comamonas serinivorans]